MVKIGFLLFDQRGVGQPGLSVRAQHHAYIPPDVVGDLSDPRTDSPLNGPDWCNRQQHPSSPSWAPHVLLINRSVLGSSTDGRDGPSVPLAAGPGSAAGRSRPADWVRGRQQDQAHCQEPIQRPELGSQEQRVSWGPMIECSLNHLACHRGRMHGGGRLWGEGCDMCSHQGFLAAPAAAPGRQTAGVIVQQVESQLTSCQWRPFSCHKSAVCVPLPTAAQVAGAHLLFRCARLGRPKLG